MLNIPHQKREIFARHFIDRVFCELRFERRPIDWEKVKPAFAEAMTKVGLPTTKTAVEAQIELPGLQLEHPEKPPGVGIKSWARGLSAFSSDGKKTIELMTDRLIVSDQSYDNFGPFWKLVEGACNAVEPLVSTKTFSWIGIRKVNRVTGEIDAKGYEGDGVNDLLFAPLRKGQFDGRSFQIGEVFYALQEGPVTCNLRTRSQRDANPKVVTMTLDMDFNQNVQPAASLVEVTKIAENLNDRHFDLFCWAVDPQMLEAMRTP